MFYILQTIYLTSLIYYLEASSNFYIDSLGKYDYEDMSKNKDPIYSSTVSPLTTATVDKVSRRHYEIVNVLWRKTKIFLDVDALTTSQQLTPASDPSLTTVLYTTNQCLNQSSGTTPSGIEFYYLDKLEQLRKQKVKSNQVTDPQSKDLKVESKQQNKAGDKLKPRIIRRPIFAFHLNNKNIKEDNVDSANFYLNLNKNYGNLDSNETNQLRSLMNTSAMISNKRIARNNNNDSQWFSIFFNDPLNRLVRSSTNKPVLTTESTTIYDRIKFFEMYDKNTEPSNQPNQPRIVEDLPNVIVISSNNDCDNKTQIVNSDIEQSQSLNILNSIQNPAPFLKEPGILLKKIQTILNDTYKTKTNEKLSLNAKALNEVSTTSAVCKRTPNVWSKFPYIAAYIYEPLSIYCDAAAINSYWLIAAGSCLARHHKTKTVAERSAYISYCSDKWWETESVAYVRRSLIHPSYSNRDKTRRHHYNIGAVQVITSMINNCVGWSPISLVSHKFVINEKGFPATAIGWGLDRYNTRYLSYHLPKRTLVAYEGLIFPKSCPKQGEHNNEEYERELNVKNIYCLSLPYMGDKKDTSHGSLLLVQGKLMALSLQKGRSNSNESTAQYTGVWRLVPWVVEITRNSTNETLTTKMIAM